MRGVQNVYLDADYFVLIVDTYQFILVIAARLAYIHIDTAI